MPAVAAAAIAAGASLGGAALASRGANKSAQLQTNAQLEAAKLQKQSNDAALAFQQQQAALDAQRAEATNQANYGQWAARQTYLSSLGQQLGLPARNIPAYVSTLGQSVGSAPGAPATARTLASIDPSKDLGGQISAYFKSQGVSDQETPYWVQKWPELVARGNQLNDPQYAAKRLAAAEIFGGTSAGANGAVGNSSPYATTAASAFASPMLPYANPYALPTARLGS